MKDPLLHQIKLGNTANIQIKNINTDKENNLYRNLEFIFTKK
jgi:hypothetical protein